ncbi:MAG: ankyrin repeat domain-containing protein [Candidatus Dependentiae bacterium]|nr:ankyrin repeat domain-containing protein [Candidatus Dependentiae bacterium]
MKTIHICFCMVAAGFSGDIVAMEGNEKECPIKEKFSTKKEELLEAIKGGDLKKTELLLEKNPRLLNTPLTNGQRALHIAISYGRVEIAQKLCAFPGIKINAQDKLQRTPLHLASARGDIGAITLLCGQKQIEVNIADAEESTPLLDSIKKGGLKAIEALCAYQKVDVLIGDSDGSLPIHVAAAYNLPEAIDFFITKKAVPVDIKNGSDYTPLHTASLFGNQEAIKILVKNKANLQAVTKKTRALPSLNPIGLSLISDHYVAAVLLIKLGARMSPKVWKIMRKRGKVTFRKVVKKLITNPYVEQKNFTSENEWDKFYKSIYNATKNKRDKKPLTGACKAYVQLITAGMGEQTTNFSEKEVAAGKKYFKQFPPQI